MLLQAVQTQSSLDPVGPLAANTARLWWFALAVATGLALRQWHVLRLRRA